MIGGDASHDLGNRGGFGIRLNMPQTYAPQSIGGYNITARSTPLKHVKQRKIPEFEK